MKARFSKVSHGRFDGTKSIIEMRALDGHDMMAVLERCVY